MLALYALEEVERVQRLEQEHRDVEQAYLMNHATNAPNLLERDRRELLGRLGRRDTRPVKFSREELQAAAEQFAAGLSKQLKPEPS